MTLNGNASQAGNVLRLTPSLEGQAGSAWRTAARAHLADGFDTTFTFRIATDGADGMAFVIQDESSVAVGGGGSGLGFEGMPRSLAIEIDTFGFLPETDNHVSVQTRGNSDNSPEDIHSIAQYNVFQDLNDGNTHSMTIRYRPGFLLVFLDGGIAPIINVSLDLTNINGDNILDGSGDSWVGFTGGTGGVFQTHDVHNWSFNETGDPLPGGACCLLNGCVASNARNCGLSGGYYAGDGTDCGTADCTGACCYEGGCSWFMTIQACADEPGTFMGVGTECPNFTCMGACCTPNGECVLASLDNCTTIENGVFHGANTSCVPMPCPLPPVGGCCDATNECLMKTQAQCTTDNGTWFGQGTSCLNVNCFDDPPPFGACCQPGGVCVEAVAQIACELYNGTYNGNDSLCINSECSVPCNCLNSTPVSGFQFFNDSTTGQTACLGSDCNLTVTNSPARVYSLIAQGGSVYINTCNGADFDSIISVHSGCPMTDANLVACDHAACDLGAAVSFCATQGQAYYIRVGGVGSASGDFTFLMIEFTAGIQEGPFLNPANGHWYYKTTGGTWTANEQLAISKGGHLATINDAAENAWIVSNFAVPSGGGMMIGINDATTEGAFTWLNGDPVTYTNWLPGQPDDGGGSGEDYGFLALDGQWMDQVNCPVNNGGEAVIEVESVMLPGILAGPIVNPANCHTYYMTQPGTWPETQLKAEALGGNLVTINDAAENEFVRSTFAQLGGNHYLLWLGLRDTATEGTFIWADGTPLSYANWQDGEPNNINNEDYVAMNDDNTGKWNDANGGLPLYGVVEINTSCSSQGDMNCSGSVTTADIPIFVAVLLGNPGFPGCPTTHADMNGDTLINGKDISLFTDALTP